MIPVLTRRVRIVTATIAVLIVVALLSAPTSVLSIVAGSDDHPLLPAPPALELASSETTSPGKQDVHEMQDVQAGLPASVYDPFDIGDIGIEPGISDLERRAEQSLLDLVTDDTFDLTQILILPDGDGLLDGSDSLQAGHRPWYGGNGGGSGFLRGGGSFLAGGGGFGRAASAGGSTVDSESTDGSSVASSGTGDAGDRGTQPDGSQPGTIANNQAPGTEFDRSERLTGANVRTGVEGGETPIDLVFTTPEVPGMGGYGPGIEPPPSDAGPVDPFAPVPVPEPASLVLTGLGLAGLVARKRRAARAARQQAGLADSHIAEKHAANRP